MRQILASPRDTVYARRLPRCDIARARPTIHGIAMGPPDPSARSRMTEDAFAEMMRKRHRQIFWQDNCKLANSYYFDRNGDVPLRPATTLEVYWRSRRLVFSLEPRCQGLCGSQK